MRPPRASPSRPLAYELRLYVAGQTPGSLGAIGSLREICAGQFLGRYSIVVIDLLKNPRLARGDQISALPALIRRLPPPIVTIIGDLSRTQRELVGLELKELARPPAHPARHHGDPIRPARDSSPAAGGVIVATTGPRMHQLRQLHARAELTDEELQLLADHYLEHVEPPADEHHHHEAAPA